MVLYALFVDRKHSLYVANSLNGTVTVYPVGATSPSETLTTGNYPVSVVVGLDETVYVANATCLSTCGNGATVTEYQKGKTLPSQMIKVHQGEYPEAVALDSSNNLYVVVVGNISNHCKVLKFEPGSLKGTNLKLQDTSNSCQGLTIDKNNDLLLVETFGSPSGGGAVYVYPPGSRKPSRKIFPGMSPNLSGGSNLNFLALDSSNKKLWVNGGFTAVIYGFTYPAGKIVDTINGGSSDYTPSVGIATSPEGSD
jgi:hypothetical protein